MNFTSTGSSSRISRATRPRRAVPAVWELDGPTITGPITSRIDTFRSCRTAMIAILRRVQLSVVHCRAEAPSDIIPQKPIILVVDDDTPILILMRSLLREFGFEPVTAATGEQA